LDWISSGKWMLIAVGHLFYNVFGRLRRRASMEELELDFGEVIRDWGEIFKVTTQFYVGFD
jgi:hypothetical protein